MSYSDNTRLVNCFTQNKNTNMTTDITSFITKQLYHIFNSQLLHYERNKTNETQMNENLSSFKFILSQDIQAVIQIPIHFGN